MQREIPPATVLVLFSAEDSSDGITSCIETETFIRAGLPRCQKRLTYLSK